VFAINYKPVLTKTSVTIEGKCQLWANYFSKPTYACIFNSQESAQPKLKESNQIFHEQFSLLSSF
jgi:hypothetical protein